MRNYKPGLVSTVIPVYNRCDMLKEAVQSVLSQTYRPVEIVIVDDGSTDQTPQIIDGLAREWPSEIRVIHQDNRGPGLAREAGRLIAKGEFIQYLDSDDALLPQKFELQVTGLRQNPYCGVSYGYTRYRYRDGTVGAKPWKGSGIKVMTMFPSFLRSRWWDTPNPLYRAEVCDKAGPWTNLRQEEDWEYDCRIAALNTKLHFCPEYVVEVRERTYAWNSTGRDILKDRARAHKLIIQHARRAGIDDAAPEMRHFARELFLLSRQCGAAGLVEESQMLFNLAREASGPRRGACMDFTVYQSLAGVFGWGIVGKMSCWLDLFWFSNRYPYRI